MMPSPSGVPGPPTSCLPRANVYASNVPVAFFLTEVSTAPATQLMYAVVIYPEFAVRCLRPLGYIAA